MISLADWGFKPGARRALFIGPRQAAVFHRENNGINRTAVFEAGDEGRRKFRHYLDETPGIPMYVLVDLVDEEYRRDTIPHVSRRDRRALLKRKAGRYFRDNPYCFYKVTGRESGGRRNDTVLISSLTDAAVVRQWLALAEETGTPVAGICSLPIFTGQLLAAISNRSDGRRLLVSLQSISGLRQTYFDNGEFQFSRLVQAPRSEPDSRLQFIRAEVEKVQRYLNSQRPVAAGRPLHIHFLMAGDLLRELETAYVHQEFASYNFCNLDELLQEPGSCKHTSTPFSDLFIMQRFLRARPGNCYASAAETRYFSLRRLRILAGVTGIMLLLGSTGWSGPNFLAGVAFKWQGDAAQEQAQVIAGNYELARQRLPETPVEASDLKTVVWIADSLARYKASPIELVRLLSHSLDRFPAVQLSSLAWVVAGDPGVIPGRVPVDSGLPVALDVSGAGAAPEVYHVALLEGRIEPFGGNYREAMNTVEQLAEDLRARATVRDVSIVSMPLDLSSGAALQGSTKSLQQRAEFTLKVVSASVGRRL